MEWPGSFAVLLPVYYRHMDGCLSAPHLSRNSICDCSAVVGDVIEPTDSRIVVTNVLRSNETGITSSRKLIMRFPKPIDAIVGSSWNGGIGFAQLFDVFDA